MVGGRIGDGGVFLLHGPLIILRCGNFVQRHAIAVHILGKSRDFRGMIRSQDGIERPHGIFALGDALQKEQQCPLGIFLKYLGHLFAAHAERLKRFLSIFRQFVRRTQTNQHGVGGRGCFFGPHPRFQKRRTQRRYFLPSQVICLSRAAGSVGEVNNLRSRSFHGVGERVHGIAQQTYTILTELKVCAHVGHGCPGFFRTHIKGHAHLGRVFGENQQFILLDACRTCGCGNFSQPLGRHRQSGGHFQQILTEDLKVRIVKIRNLFYVGHAGFIINGQLDWHGHGSGLSCCTHQPPIQVIPLGTQGVSPLTVGLCGLLDALRPSSVF